MVIFKNYFLVVPGLWDYNWFLYIDFSYIIKLLF